ncbi:thiamine biosynthesis protein ThiS [Kiloniella litopenaei]|uniref:Thiamine biosynthesis protein ThiS n=1 Tax=Kiloniella litopenaei TaxID=1549748 RepID=A0A0M2R8W6_9PROT|nr:MoaD/ThiS family protein [Kiloniella litopenaei]KKJ78126.1 thiamine biosynthesis protein ThiS [Kiloniella litopenaei]
MVQVTLSGTIQQAAGGISTLEIEAKNIRQLLNALEKQCPALKPELEKGGIAVAINGTIYRDDWFQPIPEDSEVFLIPRLAGG